MGLAFVDLVHEDGRREMDAALRRATSGAVVHLRAPGGKSAWVQLATAPLDDGAGGYACPVDGFNACVAYGGESESSSRVGRET